MPFSGHYHLRVIKMKFDSLLEEVLTEGVLENIKKQFPHLDKEINFYSENVLPHDKKNIDWVIKQHNKGNISYEDADKLKNRLSLFDANKKLIGLPLSKVDYKGLLDVTDRFATKQNTNELNDDSIKVTKHYGYKELEKMGSLPENNPHHAELNGHAKWCISLRGGHNIDYVNNYTQNGRFPVYSILNKKTHRKYALVKTDNIPDIRDEKDDRVHHFEFVYDNPSVMKTKLGQYLLENHSDLHDVINSDFFKTKNPTNEQLHSFYKKAKDDNDYIQMHKIATHPNSDNSLIMQYSGNDAIHRMVDDKVMDVINHPKFNRKFYEFRDSHPRLYDKVSKLIKLDNNEIDDVINSNDIDFETKRDIVSKNILNDSNLTNIFKHGNMYKINHVSDDISTDNIGTIIKNGISPSRFYDEKNDFNFLSNCKNITPEQLYAANKSSNSNRLVLNDKYPVDMRKADVLKGKTSIDKVEYHNKPIDDEEFSTILKNKKYDPISKHLTLSEICSSDKAPENIKQAASEYLLNTDDEDGKDLLSYYIDKIPENHLMQYYDSGKSLPHSLLASIKDYSKKPLLFEKYKQSLIDNNSLHRLSKLNPHQMKQLYDMGKLDVNYVMQNGDDLLKNKFCDDAPKHLNSLMNYDQISDSHFNHLFKKALESNNTEAVNKGIVKSNFSSEHIPQTISYMKRLNDSNSAENMQDVANITHNLLKKHLLLTNKQMDEVINMSKGKDSLAIMKQLKDSLTVGQCNVLFNSLLHKDYKNMPPEIIHKLYDDSISKLNNHLKMNVNDTDAKVLIDMINKKG